MLHTANGECRPNGSIIMDIKVLNETSSAVVLENTPDFLSVGLRCMEYGYSLPDILGMIKGLQRQTSVGTLVNSKERRALAVALMKR